MGLEDCHAPTSCLNRLTAISHNDRYMARDSVSKGSAALGSLRYAACECLPMSTG